MEKFKKICWLIIFISFAGISLLQGENKDNQETQKTYHLVWEDTFDQPELNTYNWVIEENGEGGGNREMQYYRKENLSIGKEPASGKNCLIITAKKEDFKDKNFTSGRLTTQDRITFKYGKLEARIKLPQTADGLWPAFWLLGADYPAVGWPRCGEIDILEAGHIEGIQKKLQNQ